MTHFVNTVVFVTNYKLFTLLFLLFLKVPYSSTTSDNSKLSEKELEELYDECAIGNVFDGTSGECDTCSGVIESTDLTNPYILPQSAPSGDAACYEDSNCVVDPISGEQQCTCEYPLTLMENADNSCSTCKRDSDCLEDEFCIELEYHGNICATPCTTNSDCRAYDDLMICKEPFYLESTRNEVTRICGCNSSYDFVRGFGCRDKVNTSENALDCYSCEGRDCALSPYEITQCGLNQGCFIKTTIKNWTPRSFDDYDYIFFNIEHSHVTRGCSQINSTTESTRLGYLSGNTSLWQNCYIVDPDPKGDESKSYIECFSTCVSRLCNWQVIDPIVAFQNDSDNDDFDFLILFGLLFYGSVIGCLLYSLYRHKKAVDGNKEDALLEQQKGYGATDSDPKSKSVTETEEVKIKASSKIDTGIKKRPPTEISLGSSTKTREVPDEDDSMGAEVLGAGDNDDPSKRFSTVVRTVTVTKGGGGETDTNGDPSEQSNTVVVTETATISGDGKQSFIKKTVNKVGEGADAAEESAKKLKKEMEDVTLSATSRINTGIKKRPATEIKLGSREKVTEDNGNE